jgi:homoserine kinase type II
LRPGWVFFKAVDFDRPLVDSPDASTPWIQRAVRAVESQIREIPHLLARWRSVPLPVHPCVCDVWHDHVLFAGDEVTGIIDFGSLKIDNVAVDLARMLGSMVGDDKAMFEAGLDAYATIRPLSEPERKLAPILDRTGVVLGLANWLWRLHLHGCEFQDRTAVAKRMSELVRRVENWASVEP